METRLFPSDMTVEEAIARHPEIISIFLRYRMACVGCAMARFDTLADAAKNYGLDSEDFRKDLRQQTETRLRSP